MRTRLVDSEVEARIISGAVVLVSVVLAICLSVFIVASLLYGVAYLRVHWPV